LCYSSAATVTAEGALAGACGGCGGGKRERVREERGALWTAASAPAAADRAGRGRGLHRPAHAAARQQHVHH